VAAWLSALGQGQVSESDCCASLIVAATEPASRASVTRDSHRVVDDLGAGGTWESAVHAIVNELGAPFRADLLLPRSGDSRGITAHLAECINSGAVVLCRSANGSVLLVPESSVDDTMTWLYRCPGEEMSVHIADMQEADRDLRRSILHTDSGIKDLDLIPRFDDGREFVNDDSERWARTLWPRWMSTTRTMLAVRAARLITSVEAALTDDGGAWTAERDSQRRRVLDALDLSSRRALESALAARDTAAV
jgi:hypothetical protein